MLDEVEYVENCPRKRIRCENVVVPPDIMETTTSNNNGLEKFLSCSPAVSSVLGAFPLRQWLHFRLISWAWKGAIDVHVAALQLKHVSMGEILGKHGHKCNDVLQFFARTAPHLHCISFDTITNASAMEIFKGIRDFKELKALDLTGLPASAAYGLLESLDENRNVEQLLLPMSPALPPPSPFLAADKFLSDMEKAIKSQPVLPLPQSPMELIHSIMSGGASTSRKGFDPYPLQFAPKGRGASAGTARSYVNTKLLSKLQKQNNPHSLATAGNSESRLGNDQNCKGAAIPRLRPCFQSLCSLKFLDMGSLDGLHPLLLNLPAPENLKELRVSGFTDQCQTFILRCRNLERLTLCSLPGIQESIIDALAQMKNLKSVALNFGETVEAMPSEAGLLSIAQLPKLQSLDISGWKPIPWHLFQMLTHLTVHSPPDADVLNQLTSLVSLRLNMVPSVDGLSFTCQLPKLTTLVVGLTATFPESPSFTIGQPPSALTELKSLSFRSECIEKFLNVNKFLPKAPHIEELTLDFLMFFPGQKEELRKRVRTALETIARGCPNLRTLSLRLNKLHEEQKWFNEEVVEGLLPEVIVIFVEACPLLQSIQTNQHHCRFFRLSRLTFPQLRFSFQDDHFLTCQICNKPK